MDAVPDWDEVQRVLTEARRSPEALGVLLQMFQGDLDKLARMMLTLRQRVQLAPSSAVQETFAKAIRAFPRFQGEDPQRFRAWLKKILRNYILDQPPVVTTGLREQDPPTPAPEAGLDPAKIEKALELLAQLSELDQRVVKMRMWESKKYAEIGEKVGRSEDATRRISTGQS